MSAKKLTKGDKANFSTMLRAARNGDLALLPAKRKDGTSVALVAATQKNPDGSMTLVPLAEMVSGNPFVTYEDPTL